MNEIIPVGGWSRFLTVVDPALHHLISVVTMFLTVALVASVLKQRKPSGSAFAWILVIVLIPYLGIPLYLMFGGRKFRRAAQEKAPLPVRSDAGFSRLDWLESGESAFAAFQREIRGAVSSIRIETFVLGNDETGRALVRALTEKARAGVSVHLLLDDLLSFHAPHDLLREFQAAGGRFCLFMPLMHRPFRGHSNLRNHRKIAVFDGRVAITGGMNLADEYMGASPSPSRWRDLSVRLEGSAVLGLDEIFRRDWLFSTHEELSSAQISPTGDETAVELVPTGPDSGTDTIYEGILGALFMAKKRFWVATPYFIPDEVLNRALIIAAHRGVDVRVIVPQRSNHGFSDLAANSFLADLETEGVKVWCYQPGMLHAKALLVDDELAVVGSANFDMRSLFLNFEIALFLRTGPEISRLGRWFEETLSESREGLAAAGPALSWVQSVARLFAPLL